MPQVSRFFGISIYMHFDDHPPPHFHVKYNEFNAIVSIEELKVIRGKLPPRVLGLVMEWASLHIDELKDNWKKIENKQSLNDIEPLN